MDKPKMRYCLKLDKEKYYYRIDPITAEKIIAKEIKKQSGEAKENDKKTTK